MNVRLLGVTFRVVEAAVNVSVTFTVWVRPPPVTVMVPVLVPTTAVVGSTLTLTVPLFEPLAGLTVSQLTASETLQATFDVTDSDWAPGFAAPCVALKAMLVEPTVRVGAGALSVSVTVTVRVRPPPVTVMVPVLLPSAAVAVSTVTDTVPLLEPLAGLTVSQLTASETLQATFDVIDSDWAAGFAAPCAALKAMLVEPTVRDGAGGLTVNETGMV